MYVIGTAGHVDHGKSALVQALTVIDLLGIEHGVVAVTKADLVEPELAELAAADVEESLRGTTLEGATTVICSAVSRQGLDELVATLQTELARTPVKRDIGRPRLPIDRAFTIAGFGTVVTGTLIAGSLAVGQEVEILPPGLRSRVRGLQTH